LRIHIHRQELVAVAGTGITTDGKKTDVKKTI
jgi:hypothetical protein